MAEKTATTKILTPVITGYWAKFLIKISYVDFNIK